MREYFVSYLIKGGEDGITEIGYGCNAVECDSGASGVNALEFIIKDVAEQNNLSESNVHVIQFNKI